MRLNLVSLCDTSWSNVIKILKPLEIRACYTTSIYKHVWGTNNSLSLEDLLSLVGGWSISTLKDGLNFNLVGISCMKRFLNSSWDHAVSFFQEERVWIAGSILSGFWIAGKRSMLDQVLLHILNIKTIWVMDSGVILNDSSDLSSVSLNEFRCPVSDSTETLDNECLVFDSDRKIDFVNK